MHTKRNRFCSLVFFFFQNIFLLIQARLTDVDDFADDFVEFESDTLVSRLNMLANEVSLNQVMESFFENHCFACLLGCCDCRSL